VLQHAADVGQEAHVEHPIGFVEDQDLQPLELRVGEAEVVQEPSRRGHDHVHARPEGVLLRPHADAAEDGRARHRRVHGHLVQVLVDLGRQLARRGDDERAGHAAALRHEAVEDGQDERRRLAAARHGTGKHVAAFHRRGDRVLLDRGGAREAHLLDAAEKSGVKPEG
jgi:hypothetical protein